MTSSIMTAVPTGPHSAGGAPGLPAGFADTFTSRWVAVGDNLRLHAVTGGEGPPLLLLAGWPQTWYGWRAVMPALARDFTVVVPDPRGAGMSDKPTHGYDTATLAGDMVELMATLGHERFAMVGHDVGMWTGYALAADHPGRLERLALAEAIIPGLIDSPPLFAPRQANDTLWHFAFNRLADVNEQLVAGRERLFFGWQFASKAATPLEPHAIDLYIDAIASSPESLSASFNAYRALDATISQNTRRRTAKLTIPLLTIAGDRSAGRLAEATIAPVAGGPQSHIIIPGCGHYVAEEAPEELLAALTDFLAPYRDS